MGTASFGSSTNNEDEVTVNYTGFDQGEEAQFSADIDFQAGNNQPDITNVLFGDPSDSSLGPTNWWYILPKVKLQNKLWKMILIVTNPLN